MLFLFRYQKYVITYILFEVSHGYIYCKKTKPVNRNGRNSRTPLLCIHYSYCYYVSSLKAILLLLLCYDLFYKNQVNQIGSRATPEKQLTK